MQIDEDDNREIPERMYHYDWLPGTMVQPDKLAEFAKLYSEHYGVWGESGKRPGETIGLSPGKLREDFLRPDTWIYYAKFLNQVVGYAIAARANISGYGKVAWVTQLVVHEDHRRQDVAKTLLFSIWRFTNLFAWGLLSANPYAVRALEKATRRRCLPSRIVTNADELMEAGAKSVPYLPSRNDLVVTVDESRVNTRFFLSHSKLPEMMRAVINEQNPWLLGDLPSGWEWFAFTFLDQQQIGLTHKELSDMLAASDSVTRHAYSRMPISAVSHVWAKHEVSEVHFMIDHLHLEVGNTVLDFGCGPGRHALELSREGFRVTGVDYVKSFIAQASEKANEEGLPDVKFLRGDCRTIDIGESFDAAICAYDVVGSYADDFQNLKILENLLAHLRAGGYALISVMNMELTKSRAKHWFSLPDEADRLLELQASGIMEQTGNVFNPDFYMIERQTNIVYRKEQFEAGEGLPEELIIRDRRYTAAEIKNLCEQAGFNVIWSRYVRAGNWEQEVKPDKAKEILVLCQRPQTEDGQIALFTAE
jgi:2-polyprenyl-3-methyl-5-hydroxy-6-metoxy-1,4-benzoquinol methylase/GNAT superfamily N-acetyltransferase